MIGLWKNTTRLSNYIIYKTRVQKLRVDVLKIGVQQNLELKKNIKVMPNSNVDDK